MWHGTSPLSTLSTKQKSSTASTPRLTRIAQLNQNYGLYEVVPGIYQVRGFDLSDISFVRGKTGWIAIDPLISAECARAAWELFSEHRGEGLPIKAVIYSHSHGDHWGGVRGIVDEDEVRAGKVEIIAPRAFMEHTISENVFAGNAMNRRLFYQYGMLLPVAQHGFVSQGLGKRVSTGSIGLIAPTRIVEEDIGGIRRRRRSHDLPEYTEYRSAIGDEHLYPRHEGVVDGRKRHRDLA